MHPAGVRRCALGLRPLVEHVPLHFVEHFGHFRRAGVGRQFEAVLGTWEPDFLDPHANAATFAFNPDNGPDASNKTVAWRNSWKDDAVNALTEAAVKEPDEAKRTDMYKELQRKVLADGPYIGLVQRIRQTAMRSNVKGYTVGPATIFYRLVRK